MILSLTPNFSYRSMTASQYAARHGLENVPGAEQRASLLRLCSTVLEPIRHFCGDLPVVVSSGFRCFAVNLAVGGAPSSAHVDGRAADFLVEGISLSAAYDAIARADLPIDQLIAEYGKWIHASIPRIGAAPRRQLLMKLSGRGYESYDPLRAWGA